MTYIFLLLIEKQITSLFFSLQNRHCLLDVSITAVERLKRIQIYPIVLLLRFKSARQIKEIKDKMSEKAAKEMYEHALKLESEYRQYISGKATFTKKNYALLL